jgi:RNA 3'-terminal phosphate cyclase (ATP)
VTTVTGCACGALHLDGAEHAGSGTIVRYAAVLAALTATAVHVIRARARRPKPGLRPQHASAIRACAELCGAQLEGVEPGSSEFRFVPGARIQGGDRSWDIGTAGSTTMLAYSLIPMGAFSPAGLTARLVGGVFQDFAPSPHHLSRVLSPALSTMGVEFDLRVERAGYVPRGGGAIVLRVGPLAAPLRAFRALDRGVVRSVEGVAFSSHLAARHVSERMARACEAGLASAGLRARIARAEDDSAASPGAALAVWTRGPWFGADQAGARGRSAEAIGAAVASRLLEDLSGDATVDRHLADMLVLFAALAGGESSYRVPMRSEHLDTNLWLVERFGARATCEGSRVSVRGIGRAPEMGSRGGAQRGPGA